MNVDGFDEKLVGVLGVGVDEIVFNDMVVNFLMGIVYLFVLWGWGSDVLVVFIIVNGEGEFLEFLLKNVFYMVVMFFNVLDVD